jgi:chromosome segregation ATPase
MIPPVRFGSRHHWINDPMNKSAILRWFCLFLLAPLSAGCASNQPLPDSVAAAAQRQLESVIRDTRAEAAAIRNEMAATRIAAAKKEAELQELRRQVAELRQARAEQQQAFDAKQTELMTTRAERDQLVQAKAEVQAQLAELPQLRQVTVEAKAAETNVQARMKELESSMATLTTELDQVKKDLARLQNESDTKSRSSAKAGKTPRSP